MRRLAALLVVVIAVAGGVAAARPSHPRAHAAGVFHTAPHRKPPQLINHGWTPKPLRIITFVPSTYPVPGQLKAFPQAIVHSKWLKELQKAYSIPTNRPTIGAGYIVNDTPVLTAGSTANGTFDTWVRGKMNALGIIKRPEYQTIFIIYAKCTPPQSLDGFGCVSHHPSITPLPLVDPNFTTLDSYAAVLKDPASESGLSSDTRDAFTATATHELAEAATHTGPNGWYLRTADTDHPWHDVSPFVEDEASGNIETADFTAGSRWFEKFKPIGFNGPVRYQYVRIYSHFGNAHRDDPGVPVSPHPYYNVTTKQWYKSQPGHTTTVTVKGWSTKKLPKWTVAARVVAWEGSKNTPQPADFCSLPTSSFQVKNGTTFALKVKIAANSGHNTWCVVQLKSSRSATATHGDLFHPWFVGFYIPPS